MPRNTPENRKLYPHLAGYGYDDIMQRQALQLRRGMPKSRQEKILARFAEHSDVLFSYNKRKNGEMQWRAVCAREECCELINDKSFTRAGARLCTTHNYVFFEGHRIKNPDILNLHRIGRLAQARITRGGSVVWFAHCSTNSCVQMINVSSAAGKKQKFCKLCANSSGDSPKNYNQGVKNRTGCGNTSKSRTEPEWAKIVAYVQDTRGKWIAQRLCRNTECGRLVRHKKHWWKEAAKSINCRSCRTRYLVAGVRCNSAKLFAERNLISCWQIGLGGVLAPFCKCMNETCTNHVQWNSQWSLKAKQNIFCSDCGKVGRIRRRPYEQAYRKLLKSASARGIKVTLSFEQFVIFCKQTNCTYCERPIQRTMLSPKGKRSYSIASFLDRKNSEDGYSAQNIVVSCAVCNLTKNKWLSYQEMQVVGALRRGDLILAQTLVRDNLHSIHQHGETLRTSPLWRATNRPQRK